jgi:MFS transporter
VTSSTRSVQAGPRPASPAAAARAGGLHPFGVLILLGGAFLPIMDFFITNVALPSIDTSLHASAPALELVVAGYGVAYASLLVLGGRLGDRFGRRGSFLGALAGFVLASAACGLAPDAGVLIAARIVQGATAALLIPQVLATFHHTLEQERRTRALALYGATSGIAAVVGQLVGGLLVSANIAGTSWRPIFLVNVPIGLVVLLVAARVMPATRSAHPPGIDVPGTVGFADFMFVFALTVQDGLRQDALHGGLAIVPMAVLFLAGSVASPRIINRFGRAAISAGAVVQLTGLATLVAVLVTGWPHVSLLAMAAPLALVGAGQSMLFTGFFRSVLTDVPVQLGGIGSGVLITVQQSGLALGVATLGTLFLTLAPHSYPHAFATVEYVQIGIVALLAVGAAALPRFTQASADVPVIDG